MKKCSSKEHQQIEAVYYCQNCNIYICNKCDKFHSDMFQNHIKISLDKEKSEIFTGFCKEEDHSNKLIFFCKTHNVLCCSSCLCKIKKKGYGQHKDCDVCEIEDIKEEKKNKYEENIKYLDELSKNIQNTINELKLIFDKIEKNKEELKLQIQKIFTKIRSSLNEREDELLLLVDEKYKELYIGEDIIKENEKLPNQIKLILEKRNQKENKWNNNDELNININECLEIENKINTIKKINSVSEPKNLEKIKIIFYPDENRINEFIGVVKNFGKILSPNICSICGETNNLRKCLCKQIFCLKCLNGKKNTKCLKTCYLFNNEYNYINTRYNISKYPLPKNFEIKLNYSVVNCIRAGITFDKNIIYFNSDADSPKYDIYYIYQGLDACYTLKGNWKHFKGNYRKLQAGDNIIITLFNKELKYKVNYIEINFSEKIPEDDNKEIYLLVHDRHQDSKCNILYIAEII